MTEGQIQEKWFWVWNNGVQLARIRIGEVGRQGQKRPEVTNEPATCI